MSYTYNSDGELVAVILLFIYSRIFPFRLPNNILTNVCVSVCCAAFVIVFMVRDYRQKDTLGRLNIAIPFVMALMLYIIYCLPLWGNIARLGMHNGICGLFIFAFYSRFLFNLAGFLSRGISSKRDSRLQPTSSIAVFCRVLRIFAIFLLAFGGIFLILFF